MLQNRSFISILDFTKEELNYILDLSHQLKLKRKQGIIGTSLKGKSIALLFEKTSTRTRSAFEISIIEEGGYPSFIDISNSQFAKKESIEDSAKVLAGFYHGIEFRGFSHDTLKTLSKFSGIPIYNGLTDDEHPTQIIADIMTIQEVFPNKPLNNITVAYIGDARNNMANAWIYACAIMGINFVAYSPKELFPEPKVLEEANKIAKQSAAKIAVSSSIDIIKNADIIYTDVWVSMGEESQIAKRAKLLKPYKITMEMLKASNNPDIVFMHCLPAFHDFSTDFAKNAINQGIDIREVDDDVFRSKHSVVFQQAHNRLHTIKAILVATLGS
ncbi:MAG: ornithine carbamoyltransferase [Burkholderiales bacterium]|nr:ornithine carbamoyltransferase [Burkholderiales bacterium]